MVTGKYVSLCYTAGSKWVIVMDGFKFEFHDIISFYKNNGHLFYSFYFLENQFSVKIPVFP